MPSALQRAVHAEVVKTKERSGWPVKRTLRGLGVSPASYYRWRKEYGGLRTDQAKRFKELEQEIKKLKMALADSMLAQKCMEVVIDEANKEYKTDLKKNFAESASTGSGNKKA